MTDEQHARRNRGPYRKSTQTRQQILDAALRIFARESVDAGSLRSVASAIGVSHAALRYYFPNREALLIAVYEAHEGRDSDDDWLGTSVSPFPGMIDDAARNRAVPGLVQLYATLTADAIQPESPAATAFVSERFARLRTQIAARVQVGQVAGVVRPDIDPEDVATLIIAASDGLQVQWLLEPDVVDVGRVLRLLEVLTTSSERGRAAHP